MRAVLTFIAAALAATPCGAVDYRWIHFVFHGEEHARITNGNDAAVDIWCSIYKIDNKTAGIEIDSAKAKSLVPITESPLVQIVVDGANFPFVLQTGSIEVSNTADAQVFHGLIDALIKSRARSFSVEFPKYKLAEDFSLLSARTALRKGRRTIIDGCNFFP